MPGKQKNNKCATTQCENNAKSKQAVGTGTGNQNRQNPCYNDPSFRCPYNVPFFIPPYPPYPMGCPSDMNPQMPHGFVPFINPYMMPQCPYNIVPPCDISGYETNSSSAICPFSQMASSNRPEYPCNMSPLDGPSVYEFRPNSQEVNNEFMNGTYKSQNASNQQIGPMSPNNKIRPNCVSFADLQENNTHSQMAQGLPSQNCSNICPQMAQQLPPQMTQGLPSQSCSNICPEMAQQLPSQMAQQLSPQMTQQIPPQMAQGLPTQSFSNICPQMAQQLPPQSYFNNPQYQFNPPMASTPIDTQMTPNVYNNPSQCQGPINIAEPVREGVNRCSDKCAGFKPENSESAQQEYANIPYSCVGERFKSPDDPNSSAPTSVSPCAKCCSKTPLADEEISSNKSNSNNELNSSSPSEQSNSSNQSQASSEEVSEFKKCKKYCKNSCAKDEEEDVEVENEEEENENEDADETKQSFKPMTNSTGVQSMLGPCGHCQRPPPPVIPVTNYNRSSMDGLRYNKYQFNDSLSPFGNLQGSDFNGTLPNPNGRYLMNASDQLMRTSIADGASKTGNGKCDCIYPPSMGHYKCCGKTYGNCECASKQN